MMPPTVREEVLIGALARERRRVLTDLLVQIGRASCRERV